MACPFEIVVAGHDEAYARQAADAVFREIDHLEEKLSRFIEHSDVGRIAAARPGEQVRISPETMDCLLAALWAYRETGGAFDISLGRGMDDLVLDPDSLVVRNIEFPITGSQIFDLGGIGKGYALDVAADVISDWQIGDVLLSAGASTALALGSNGDEDWSIGLHGEPLKLRDCAVSGSGKDVKGEHVIDPRKGMPAAGHEKAWAVCPSAAAADALSTAFMVMSTDEVKDFCRNHEEIRAFLLNEKGDILSFPEA